MAALDISVLFLLRVVGRSIATAPILFSVFHEKESDGWKNLHTANSPMLRPPVLALVKVSDWNSFRTNQIYSDSFRNLFPRQSELIRVNPKKVFNLVWCNSIKNQSISIRINPRFLILIEIQSESIRLNPRLPIQINLKEVLNPNESEVRVI